jgi:hypothetical protein
MKEDEMDVLWAKLADNNGTQNCSQKTWTEGWLGRPTCRLENNNGDDDDDDDDDDGKKYIFKK